MGPCPPPRAPWQQPAGRLRYRGTITTLGGLGGTREFARGPSHRVDLREIHGAIRAVARREAWSAKQSRAENMPFPQSSLLCDKTRVTSAKCEAMNKISSDNDDGVQRVMYAMYSSFRYRRHTAIADSSIIHLSPATISQSAYHHLGMNIGISECRS